MPSQTGNRGRTLASNRTRSIRPAVSAQCAESMASALIFLTSGQNAARAASTSPAWSEASIRANASWKSSGGSAIGPLFLPRMNASARAALVSSV